MKNLNPYVWIVQYEFLSPRGRWEPAVECYEHQDDAKRAVVKIDEHPSLYRKAHLINCELQNSRAAEAQAQVEFFDQYLEDTPEERPVSASGARGYTDAEWAAFQWAWTAARHYYKI